MADAIEPSAPKLYPQLNGPNELNAENFRLNKANLILAYLESQAKHYEEVRKKYARARSVLHKIAVTTSSLSVALTSSGLATALTGSGIIVGLPLGAVGGICGIISAFSAGVTKKLSTKISKHDATIALSRSKVNSINDLVSKALRDGRIDDTEFSIILAEEKLKSDIRNKKIIVKNVTEEERKKIFQEVKNELQKRLAQ